MAYSTARIANITFSQLPHTTFAGIDVLRGLIFESGLGPHGFLTDTSFYNSQRTGLTLSTSDASPGITLISTGNASDLLLQANGTLHIQLPGGSPGAGAVLTDTVGDGRAEWVLPATTTAEGAKVAIDALKVEIADLKAEIATLKAKEAAAVGRAQPELTGATVAATAAATAPEPVVSAKTLSAFSRDVEARLYTLGEETGEILRRLSAVEIRARDLSRPGSRVGGAFDILDVEDARDDKL